MTGVSEARAQELADGVLRGEARSLARALRIVDDRTPGFVSLLKLVYPRTGRAYVLGVTGTPGAGKSTLVDRLVTAFRARGDRVGVVAVDPTSPFTGGAILGDRIRMQRHFLDEGVFIRSLATRGQLGGLSRSAADVVHVLDAAGYDVVVVETVGVGQDELEVTKLAHTTLVVTAPGLGDDIQAIKAGILEVADVLVVNKADRDGADATARDLEQMIALGRETARASGRSSGHSAASGPMSSGAAEDGTWIPRVQKTVATRGDGMDELVEACLAHRAFADDPARARDRDRRRAAAELHAVLQDVLVRECEARVHDEIEAALDALAARRDDPYSVTERLVARLLAGSAS